jgi:hypothetical protein
LEKTGAPFTPVVVKLLPGFVKERSESITKRERKQKGQAYGGGTCLVLLVGLWFLVFVLGSFVLSFLSFY